MGAADQFNRPPVKFTKAVNDIANTQLRPQLVTETIPPPRRIAPHAHAISGDVVVDDTDLATGRFILLFDPHGEESWGGEFRCVAYARAEIEAEMATDPALPDVGWSWLTEALNTYAADSTTPSGSVTVVRSEAYGQQSSDASGSQIEIRASWTPLGAAPAHVEAWAELLCRVAGLPPEGIIALTRGRP